MWLVAINPSSGHGKGSTFGKRVTDYLSSKEVPYRVFSAQSASQLRNEIESSLDSQRYHGVISVGGDGLAHLILQLAVPRFYSLCDYPCGNWK